MNSANWNPAAENISLSPSMDGMLKSFVDKHFSAVEIINEILNDHGRYGRGLAKTFEGLEEAGKSERNTTGTWFGRVLAILDTDQVQELNGRLVVLALGLLEQHSFFPAAAWDRLYAAIQAEFKPPFETLLNETGLALWQRRNTSFAQPEDTPEQVSFQSGATNVEPQVNLSAEPKTTAPPIVNYDDIRFRLDDPVEKDALGRDAFAEAFAQFLHDMMYDDPTVKNEKSAGGQDTKKKKHHQSAFMVNIFGPWGSGKSTLLNLLRKHLQEIGKKERKEWLVVEFNAWQHQGINPPWWPFLHTVRKGIRQGLSMRRVKFLVRDAISSIRIRHKLYLTFLILIAILFWVLNIEAVKESIFPDGENWVKNMSGVGAILTTITAIGTVFWSISKSLFPQSVRGAQYFVELKEDPYALLKEKFTGLIDLLGEHRRLAIFIDDLDRCEGQYVVSLLEGIQTIFKKAPVVYVVAADIRWLQRSYSKHYQGYADAIEQPGHNLGHLFMEKIFQLSIPMPQISDKYRNIYWADIRSKTQVSHPSQRSTADLEDIAKKTLEKATSIGQVMQAIRENEDPELESVLRSEGTRRLVSDDVKKSTQQHLDKFAPFLGNNPRAMIRTLNNLVMFQLLTLQAGLDEYMDYLPLWVILKMRWPVIAEILKDDPGMIKYIKNQNYTMFHDDISKVFYLNEDEVHKVVTGDAEGIDVELTEEMIKDFSALSYL